jgi:nucleolar protein 56
VNANLAPSEFEANNLLRRFAIDLSSAKVSEVSAKRDLHIIQAVNTLDELDKIINTMGARLREWYGLHFPELDGILQSLNAYCEIVSAGMRGMITDDVLEKAELQERTDILNAARSSRGGVITDENIQALQKLADEIRHLAVVRDNLTAHLEREMDEIAPNIKEILGATIGARMIAKVGSLERLAVLPASTIQVIGAEKALFRALKTGSRPPKHGILFQHPLVHSAPKWQRGKIARAIAAKVVIAARIDAYTGVKNPSLSAKLNERIEEIRQKYSEPVEREHFEETRGREFGGERYGGERGRGGREGRDRGGRERGRDRGRYRHRGKGGRGRDGDRGKERGGRRNERRRRFGRRRR